MKARSHLVVVAALTALVAHLAPQRAEACSPPLQCPEMRYPLDGATGVPTNTLLWTRYQGTLSLSDGVADPIELTLIDHVALPELLAPNTTYTVTLIPDPDHAFGCEEAATLTFTTGSGPDAAPAPPVIDNVETTFQPADDGNTCGPTADRFFVELSLTAPVVADAVAYRLYQVESGERLGPGVDTMMPAMPWFYINGTSVANSYEIVAVSASGLESVASEFEVNEATPPGVGNSADDACGCGAAADAGEASPMALVAMCVALLLARRRSARRSHSSH